jgi:hypothetical protein
MSLVNYMYHSVTFISVQATQLEVAVRPLHSTKGVNYGEVSGLDLWKCQFLAAREV